MMNMDTFRCLLLLIQLFCRDKKEGIYEKVVKSKILIDLERLSGFSVEEDD